MTRYIPKSDPKTGQFLPTPKGEKPPKMKEMEEKVGTNFEEDYRRQYLEGNLGQKRFAQRWQVSRSLIFANNLRGGRRSWVQMLELKKKGIIANNQSGEKLLPGCEICEKKISLHKAHWKENAKGGSCKSDNILNLCPNCHTKLDEGDKDTTEQGRKVLLFREVQKIFKKKLSKQTPERLLELSESIILERKS